MNKLKEFLDLIDFDMIIDGGLVDIDEAVEILRECDVTPYFLLRQSLITAIMLAEPIKGLNYLNFAIRVSNVYYEEDVIESENFLVIQTLVKEYINLSDSVEKTKKEVLN